MVGQEMVELVAHRGLHHARGLRAGQPVLGLALEMRVADEQRQDQLGPGHDIVGIEILDPLPLPDELRERAQPLGQGGADALRVRAAVRRRDRVAIVGRRALRPERPGDRPLDRAAARAELLPAAEEIRRRAFAVADLLLQMVGDSARELEHGLGRRVVVDQRRVAPPADLDAREQVRLGPGEPVQPPRPEPRARAEDLDIRHEAELGPAPVGNRAHLLEPGHRLAADELLPEQLLVARDLDHRVGRQRVDDADADAVEPAARLVRLVRKLAARVQRGEDHLQRRLLRELRMRIDGNAAAVVGDGQPVPRVQHHLDPRRMPRDRLVHRIVDDLRREMMQRALVRAADVHAGTAADGFEAFEDFDGGGVVGGGSGGCRREQV